MTNLSMSQEGILGSSKRPTLSHASAPWRGEMHSSTLTMAASSILDGGGGEGGEEDVEKRVCDFKEAEWKAER